ncbi:MAG: winged helix family two component transcriptional regulator [Microgenomates bacterium 39_7]|nr:MAG: winged helix family two component transcriptional regulator [Microgenomates bacterium 39_7]
MKKILIVEDDVKIANLIKLYCVQAGFKTSIAKDVPSALKKFKQQSADLIILDLMLPGSDEEDGISFLKEIRKESLIPVIIVSSRDEEVDRVVCLELGADDYMTKPFSPKELIARIKAVLRRSSSANSSEKLIKVGKLKIDLEKVEVTFREEKIVLTKKEFFLITALAKHPGKVFSRSQLIEAIYDYDEMNIYDRTIDVHIANLRKKLGDDDQSLIKTAKGLGYKLVGELDES